MAVELASAYVSLVPSFKGGGAAISKELGAPMQAAGKDIGADVGKKMSSGIVGPLKGLGAAIGGAFAVSKGFDFLQGAVGAASDLNETVSKSRTIFGPASADLEKWASGAATAFGQSKQQALDAAGTFGNLFVQLGVSTDKAAGMSKQMVQLASDFASFHNADPQAVIEAQTAAFRGEYDALQRFVPTISAATVEQEALRMTGKKTTKELSAQEKALAVQALMMKGAGDATGDFARTSDGLANKQRIFAARMDDLKAKIGNGLLPVISAVTGFMSDKMIPAFDAIGRFASQVFKILFKGDFTGGPFAEDSKFVDTLFDAREALQGLVKFVRGHLTPVLIGVGYVLTGLAVTFGGPLVAIAALAAAAVLLYVKFKVVRDVIAAVADFLTTYVVPAVTEFAERVAEQFSSLVKWTQTHWAAISEAISHVTRVIKEIIGVFVDVVSALWRAWGDDLFRIVKTLFAYIKDTVDNVLQVVRGIIDTALALINGDWGKAWDGVKQIFAGVWDQMVNIVRTAFELIRSLLGGVVSTVSEVAAYMWDPIAAAFKSALNWIIKGWNKLEFKIPGFDPPGPGPKFGGFTLGVPDIPLLKMHEGGVVPGRVGMERFALLQAGETVLPTGAGAGTSYSSVFNISAKDPHNTAITVNQRLRDMAFLYG